MGVASLVHINFDLVAIGVAIAGIGLLGCMVYLSEPENATNRAFFAFALWNIVWSISNYFEYRFQTPAAILWALRFHLFLSTWYSFLFLRLAYVFPREQVEFPQWYRFGFLPLIAFTSLLTLTPLVFSGVGPLAPAGEVTRAVPAPGIALFMLVAFGSLISALVILFRRMRRLAGIERTQTAIVLIGMATTAVLILLFNVILPNVFANLSFIPLAGLFLLPFLALTSYAVYRHHLFDLKVATTAFLGFMLTIFSMANVVYSRSTSEVLINVTAFLVVLLGSVKILQDTLALKTLTEELSETNERQEGLLHFIGHEVKGFMAKDEGAFAALVDGDFGALQDSMKPFVEQALAQAREGVRSVTDILTASNQKKGTVNYTKAPFDLKSVAEEIVAKEKPAAEAAHLALTLSVSDGDYTVNGDREKIGENVLRNLIENAIHYTPAGTIKVTLAKEPGKAIFRVQDTGIGISEEDKAKLFTEGGHGKDSQRINAHSTGYGLYIAKNIVDAHGGSIKAESTGEGKGSLFTVELPG